MDNFDQKVEDLFNQNMPDFNKNVLICFLGNVSAGKSSLINAFFERKRDNVIAEVGATSGVTKEVKHFRLDENVLVLDSPGLEDIEKENSRETENIMGKIDVAIYVATGSADMAQKKHFAAIKSKVKNTIFVLNKIDEFDELEQQAFDEVVLQWKYGLDVKKIFPTCAKGYDPRTKKDASLRIEGVDELRNEVMNILAEQKKDILLKKTLSNKRPYAIGTAVTAIIAAGGEAMLPGSTVYITATQAVAIATIAYIYTGRKLSMKEASGLMLPMIGQTAGKQLFIFASSFFPGADIVGVAVAASVTTAILASVIVFFELGYDISDSSKILPIFSEVFPLIRGAINKDSAKNSGFIEKIINNMLKRYKK